MQLYWSGQQPSADSPWNSVHLLLAEWLLQDWALQGFHIGSNPAAPMQIFAPARHERLLKRTFWFARHRRHYHLFEPRSVELPQDLALESRCRPHSARGLMEVHLRCVLSLCQSGVKSADPAQCACMPLKLQPTRAAHSLGFSTALIRTACLCKMSASYIDFEDILRSDWSRFESIKLVEHG